eukprot:scaffold114535_cov60-Phaeocystis_antarctica.AAC.1
MVQLGQHRVDQWWHGAQYEADDAGDGDSVDAVALTSEAVQYAGWIAHDDGAVAAAQEDDGTQGHEREGRDGDVVHSLEPARE